MEWPTWLIKELASEQVIGLNIEKEEEVRFKMKTYRTLVPDAVRIS